VDRPSEKIRSAVTLDGVGTPTAARYQTARNARWPLSARPQDLGLKRFDDKTWR
jgi:hypothetical protein